MKLDQVDAISLKSPKRLVDLSGGGSFVASIDFRHQKCLFAITIAQSFSDPNLARAIVVIPTVVEEIDAAIQSRPDNPDAFRFLYHRSAQVVAPESYDGNLDASASQEASRDIAG